MATAPVPVTDEGMSDSELASILAEHEQRSVGYYTSEIAADQASALDRYYRRPYGDEREGRSKVVDGTVSITVDNATAAILKPFVSSDDTVVFEPQGPEDEDQAAQATEYVNYVFHCDNPGFLILHDWFKDALLQKLGVVKAWWEDKSTSKPARILADAAQIEVLMRTEQIVGGPYGPDENDLYALDVMQSYSDGNIRVENIPPEEYRISPFARPGRPAPYEAHIRNMPRSELVEMGFDAGIVDSLARFGHSSIDDERAQARYQDEEFGSSRIDQPGDKSRDMIQVNEEFALLDYDGDGVSEMRHVIRVGDVILFNEEVERAPFAKLCPIPMPHKVYGQSLADKTMPEQRIATVLWRQTLDNLYLSNNPRVIVPQAAERNDGTTIDDILDVSPGGPIRTAQGEIVPFAIDFVADKSYPMLSYVQQQAEAQTGIRRGGNGLDRDALNENKAMTATQATQIEDRENERSEMIARIFAETGVKDLFKLMLRLLVDHQPRARMVRLRNQWVEMDPRGWNAEMDMSISVGLGVGNKAEQIFQAQTVLQTMAEVAQSPFSSLVNKEKAYNALKRLYTAAGIKNTDDFLVEPEKDEQGNLVEEPPPPDPEMMKVQADAQMQAQKLQGEQQMAGAKLQGEQQAAEFKLQAMREEMILKQQLAREEAEFEAQLAIEKMNREFALAKQQMEFETELAEKKAAAEAGRRQTETDAKISQNRPGGDLSK